MPRVIECEQCGVVLNLPDVAAGKRLKCPRCGARFQATEADTSAPSSEPGVADARADSSVVVGRGHGDADLPTAEGHLRETFDIPLMTEEAPVPAQASASKPISDALALFTESEPAPRRPSAAEARARARRCPTCGGVVPVGMSLCPSCGLDLETGTRIALEDDLLPTPPAPPPGPPIGVAIVGGTCFFAGVILTFASIVQWFKGLDGWQYFVPVCLFAIFAAVQLLRGRSAKLLLVALSLGAIVDLVALIALPIYDANVETTVVPRPDLPDNPDDADVVIPPITTRLNTDRITTGIAVLVVYAVFAMYLTSPPVRRYINPVDRN
jgi:hypothetical protein